MRSLFLRLLTVVVLSSPFGMAGTVPTYDYGDAPDASNGTGTGNYQTRLADNGPRHVLGGCYFGTPPDSEADGQPTALADGDDLAGTNDEAIHDGIGFWDQNMQRGLFMGLGLNLHCPAGQPARIYAKGWADWNQNGAFEVAEVIYQGDSGTAVQDFVLDTTFPVPANAVLGPTVIRFRTATSAIADPTGTLTSGEVQDMRIIVFQPNQYLTVNTEKDEFDTPSGANRSLREAIRDTLPFAYNYIRFDPTVRILTLTRGQLAVSAQNLDINADPARPVTVDGNQASRVFSFDSSCVINLNNLVIRNGQALPQESGGGILNNGKLQMDSCRVEYNRSGEGEDADIPVAGGDGGGLYNSGNLTMMNCRITGNQTGRGGNASGTDERGENSGRGGGIHNRGTLTLTDCAVADNATGQGGNATPGGGGGGGYGSGGGIYHYGSGAFTATRCSFTGNHADRNGRLGNGQVRTTGANGGGIYATDPIFLGNCTVAGNFSADTSYGGGGMSLFFANMVLRNCTVVNNTTTGPGGGIFCHGTADLILENSVVANNNTPHSIKDLEVSQNLTSLGVNLIGDSTGATGLQGDDLVDQDPILIPLGQYGGVGLTAPPGTGSPLHHAGFPTGDSPANDQRGVPRAAGFAPTIGAVELGEFNRAASTPAGYESADDLTRAHDTTAPVSYETFPADPASPGGEEADKAIDNLSNSGNFTKFLHVDGDGSGLDIGLKFVPVRLSGITLKSANDDFGRDPTHFILLGKNARGEYELAAEGTVPAFADRFTRQTFFFAAPTEPYQEFRLLLPAIGILNDGVMQIGEVELLGLPADNTLRFTGIERIAANQLRVTFAAPTNGRTFRFLRTTNFSTFTNLPSATGIPANGGRGTATVTNPGSVSLKIEEEQ